MGPDDEGDTEFGATDPNGEATDPNGEETDELSVPNSG